MNRQLFAIAVVFLTTVFSCSKKNHDVDPAENNPYALKVGNYWIYRIDEFQNDSITQSWQDSVYIQKDTLMEGNTYFKFVSTNNIFHQLDIDLLRDSSGYLVEIRGRRVHSFEHRGELIYLNYYLLQGDTNWIGKRIMDSQDSSFSLPAGNLMGLTCKELEYGNNQGTLTYQVTSSSAYAKNIGLIYSRSPYFYSQGSGYSSSLVRYKVN